MAQDSGAHANAALTLIEEHGPSRRLSESELVEVYRQADELLKGTQDADDIARLLAGARVVIKRLTGLGLRDRNVSFYSAVREYEARLIEQALAEAEGGVTQAAKMLGLTHQSLGYMLEKRHKGLAEKRTPVKKRLRSLIKKPKK